jgi:hypothetical protein
MRKLKSMVLAAGVLVTAACAPGVTTDYHPSVRFSPYHTFAMVSPPQSESHQLVDDRLRETVAIHLADQGLTETDRDHADLFVGYRVVDRHDDGAVLVSLLDAKTRHVVWQARADDVLSLPVRSPDRATEQVGQAVARIFTKFPPALRDGECREVDPCL